MPFKDPEQRRAYIKAHYEANAETYKERSRRHYRDNLEAKRTYRKEQYWCDPEGARSSATAYYDQNRERILQEAQQAYADDPILRARKKAAAARWLRAHPEIVVKYAAIRRARLLDLFVEDVDPLVVLELDDGVCGICSYDVDPHHFHLDHVIPLSKDGEHSYANVQVAHPKCNMSKGNKLPWNL